MSTTTASKVKALGIFLLVVSILLFGSLAHGQVNENLQVDYIDVGQGDSILLQASDGTDILIDGGPPSAGPTVVAHLQNENVDDIDVLVLTHGDADHVGGLIDVLKSEFTVESWVYNGQHHTTITYTEFLSETQRLGLTPTPAQAGQSYNWGQLNVSVLNPQATLETEQNENSVVMLVVYGDVRFLFTGDIGSETEQTLLDAITGTLTLRYQLPADVIKVPHHGSRYSSSPAFLEAVGAEVAVISVGANPYGHPTQETLDRLAAAGAKVYRTDQDGTVTITTDGQEYDIKASFVVFLPIVERNLPPTPEPSATPTSTPDPSAVPTLSPTATETPTSTPTNTPEPTATSEPTTSGDIEIPYIFYDGVKGRAEPDEYVEIRNHDSQPVQLESWTLRDEANHTFTFPSFVMQPGQVCRIYTNEYHEEWCGFSYGSGSAIWNNSGDTAYLRDSGGALVDSYSY